MSKMIEMIIPRKNKIDLEFENSKGIQLDIAKSKGTGNYNALTNKPSINGVMLIEDKSFEELGVNNITNTEILTIFKRVFGGN